jgi:putative ABC transport system permease protein
MVPGDRAGPPIFAVGVDPQHEFLYRLLRGRQPGPGELVVSEPLARDAHLEPGARVELAGELDLTLGRARSTRAFTVSGVGDFLYDYAGEHSLALTLADVRTLTARPGALSLLGVATLPGSDDAAVASAISARVPTVTAWSNRELMVEMDRRLLYFRQLATILGSVAMVVTALLVATIVTIGVRERFGEIATLRAIGIPGRRVLLAVVCEGLLLAALGCLGGLPLGLWMAGRLDRILLSFPGIPARMTFFAWDAGRVGLAMAVVIAIGALAGCIPGLGAVRAPLAQALREEAE